MVKKRKLGINNSFLIYEVKIIAVVISAIFIFQFSYSAWTLFGTKKASQYSAISMDKPSEVDSNQNKKTQVADSNTETSKLNNQQNSKSNTNDLPSNSFQQEQTQNKNLENALRQVMSNYEISFVESVNSGDFSKIEKLAIKDSNLYNEQKKLITRLYAEGIKERLVMILKNHIR